MAWVRIDDDFLDHPKMAAVGPVGWGVWLASIAWCNRELTDGFLPAAVADALGGRTRVWLDDTPHQLVVRHGAEETPLDADFVAELLVKAGLWERVPGGYRIHDYLDYQPSREEVTRRREAASRGGRAAHSRSSSSMEVETTQVEVPPEVPLEVPVEPPLQHNPNTQDPETPSLCSGVSVGGDADDPPRAVMAAWNRLMVPDVWTKPLALTPSRRRLITARLRRWSVGELCTAIERIRASPWHCGANDTHWRATPEWVFADDGRVETWVSDPPLARAGPEPRGFAAIAAFLRSRAEGGEVRGH